MTRTSYVLDAVRTPFGRYGKALAGVRPDDLAAGALSSLLERSPRLDPSRIADVIVGAANQAGEDNRNVARMAVLLAGLPTSVPGSTTNRLCGSGLDAVIQASRAVESGDGDLYVAGGVESMTRAPWVVVKPDAPFPSGDRGLVSTTLGWRLVNPAMPDRWTVSLGETAEMLADRFGISREEQDTFALSSHRRASAAWDAGVFADEIAAVPGVSIERDENIRATGSMESLAALAPAFRPEGGTVTAGNSSPLSDGAAMALIGSADAVPGLEPLCRIAARAVAANDPSEFGIAPVEAAERALRRAGRTWSDVDLVELNEAFAAQSLACLRLWPELDPERVNRHGGAIAIGHPLGASGIRILGRAAHALAQGDGRIAVVAICIGVGQALAVVLERD